MSPILQVFRKELREILRDKRVRNAATIMPLFIVALMMALFGFLGGIMGKDATRKVHVVRSSSPLLADLRKAKNLEIVEVPTEAEGLALIRDGKARLLAEFPPPKGGKDMVVLRFDPKEDSAQIAKATLMTDFAPQMALAVAAKLAAAGLTQDDLTPIGFRDEPVQVGDKTNASGILVNLLPYLLVLFTFTGGVALASDLVAGEKERSTLETLLITPVGRTEIVLGKFLALTAVCLASAASGLVGFILAAGLRLGGDLMFKSGLGLTPLGAVETFLVLLPLAAAFAGVLIAVSTFSRNTREAQTYLGLVNLVVMIPAVFSQIIGLTDLASAPWLPFVPILGAAAGIRTVLLGKATLLSVLGPVSVGIVLAALALGLAVRLFHREAVLLRV